MPNRWNPYGTWNNKQKLCWCERILQMRASWGVSNISFTQGGPCSCTKKCHVREPQKENMTFSLETIFQLVPVERWSLKHFKKTDSTPPWSLALQGDSDLAHSLRRPPPAARQGVFPRGLSRSSRSWHLANVKWSFSPVVNISSLNIFNKKQTIWMFLLAKRRGKNTRFYSCSEALHFPTLFKPYDSKR